MLYWACKSGLLLHRKKLAKSLFVQIPFFAHIVKFREPWIFGGLLSSFDGKMFVQRKCRRKSDDYELVDTCKWVRNFLLILILKKGNIMLRWELLIASPTMGLECTIVRTCSACNLSEILVHDRNTVFIRLKSADTICFRDFFLRTLIEGGHKSRADTNGCKWTSKN